MQNIIGDSKIGKCGSDQMKALQDDNQTKLIAKQKELQTQQQKMQSQQTLVSEAVMTQMQRDMDRLQREGTALQQDLQAKEANLNQDLVNAFQTKVIPILEALRVERSLWFIMAVDQAPGVVVAANANLDLSADVTKRLDAAYPTCGKRRPTEGRRASHLADRSLADDPIRGWLAPSPAPYEHPAGPRTPFAPLSLVSR